MEAIEDIITGEGGKALRGFIYRKVKDKSIADDIVQDVFIKIHTKFNQLKSGDKMISWIYQITRNTIADHFRSKSKVLEADIPDSESNTQLNECAAGCLAGMLHQLPQKYSEALQLSDMEGLSQTDLATRLEISYSGSKSRVQRARKMLKEKVSKSCHIETDVYGNVIICETRLAGSSCSKN